jgi:hypothetical protein
MAGQSLEDLLAWMKNPNNHAMLRWDAIAALARGKTNLLLAQEYIARFDKGTYLEPISGEIETVAGEWKEVIHDFVLDVPLLSFENAAVEASKARLTSYIVGGVQVSMKKDVDAWYVEAMNEPDPLQGPRLYLDLDLSKVPGIVGSEGQVVLDLKDSDNFHLTFAGTEHEQRLGGDFFKDLFNELCPEERRYLLGTIVGGTDEVLRPQSFKLRTQANGEASRDSRSADYGDGAVLIYICMVGGREGDFMGANYPYLIPNDVGGDYSATVLLTSQRVFSGVLLESVANIIDSHDFDYGYDDDGRLVSATAKSGELTVPESSHLLPLFYVGGTKTIKADVGKLVLPAVSIQPFSVRFDEGKAVLTWESKGTVAVTFSVEGLEPIQDNFSYAPSFVAEYELINVGVENERVVVRRTAFSLERKAPEVSGSLALGDHPSGWEIFLPLALAALTVVIHEKIVQLKMEQAFLEEAEVETPISAAIEKHIKLTFGQAIQGDTIRAPRDIGFFGKINPLRTSFVISPLRPIMAAGGTQQFKTDPADAVVTWKVEGLQRGTRGAGSIGEHTGLYQAPAADSIEGRFIRVRVTATGPLGHHSSALVTVLVNQLTINPLIEYCDVDEEVELAAGALGVDNKDLRWSIKNPVEGESGEVRPSELSGGDHTYVAGHKVDGKTYVLDEVVVATPSGQERSAWILVRQKRVLLEIKPATDTSLPPGKVQLKAIFNEDPAEPEWSLPMGGPGSIDADGVYSEQPGAPGRFVLIFAKDGSLNGHIILPLPLSAFPDELERMSH